MMTGYRVVGIAILMALFGLVALAPAMAQQTFNSGSTGADGAFTPTCTPTPCTVTVALPPSGIFNFTTVTIPSGVTVTFTPNVANTPVTILATGDVTVSGSGVLSLDGQPGTIGATSGPIVIAGKPGGPGGFPGGQGGARGTTNKLASGGQGPGGGGLASAATGFCGVGGVYGAPATFTNLIPLFGGSGGGGGEAINIGGSGSSGAGGGGAIVIASSTRITVNGVIRANGGNSADTLISGSAGAGSGGAIRLVSPQITGTGVLQAVSGSLSTCLAGGPGRIRLEATTLMFTGGSNPAASTSSTLGPVTAASTPPLSNLPTLRFSSIAGAGVPLNPLSSQTTPDVVIPANTVNPVPVILTATNLPVGTVFTVKVIPSFAAPTSVNSAPSNGTFAFSNATANVTLPTGFVSVLHASAGITLPQLASLFPLIDGEPVDRIMVAASYGEPSSVTLVTTSGRAMPVDRLSDEDQVRVAMAFDMLRTLTP